MKPLDVTAVLLVLFCLVACGHGRPSDADEHDEILREAKKEKHYQHDDRADGEQPEYRTEPAATSTTENVLNRLKSIAHLRMAADTRVQGSPPMTREELEALRDLLDKNLRKYQNFDDYSVRKRPNNDPYIGQILQNLNGERPHANHNSNNDNNKALEQLRGQMPIRRKIIRHTVFSSPLQNGGDADQKRGVYPAGGDGASRIEWPSSPWAEYFPILIKDPFQTVMNSFSEIIEYGPAADICRHAATGVDDRDGDSSNRMDRGARRRDGRSFGPESVPVRPDALKRSRRNTVAPAEEEKGVLQHVVNRPYKPHGHGHATTTTETPKLYQAWAPDKQATEHHGDTGPQIKRLVVRRGGVAIAGPGGIATAGSGGTAIVGPGGSAYSSKDTASGASGDMPLQQGVSMAGYGPQMVQQGPSPGYYAPYPQQHNGFGRSVDGGGGGSGGTAILSADGVAYTFPEPSRGLTTGHGSAVAGRPQLRRYDDAREDGPRPSSAFRGAQEIRLPDGAKLIATGPIVYYNPEPSSWAATKKKSRKGKKSTSAAKKRDVDYDDWST
ncbi:Domain of unknown function DUF4774 [Cinara cedri]|uniref:DUF4774 domain-containing protein n=1 Tax=Cinara cedri TaxID=506608 RepID=A0A5E4NTM4_9HEMI|nr:Domain of unknown function DUF4774 [Cinara cedri]